MLENTSRRSFIKGSAVGALALAGSSIVLNGASGIARADEAAGGIYTPGTYVGTGTGMGGKFDVTVEFSEDAILSVEVGDNNETVGIGTNAIDALPGEIIEAQSTDVATVSGATITSNAIISAVNSCIEQATGGVVEEESGGSASDMDVDVVVVGGGLAGIVATMVAAQAGADVVLVEKQAQVGGSGLLTSAGLYAVETDLVPAEMEDKEEMYNHIIEMIEDQGTVDHIDPERIQYIVDQSNGIIEWLEGMGYVFATQNYMIKNAKDHYHYLADDSGGIGQVNILMSEIEKTSAQVLTETACTAINQVDGVITGITAEQDGASCTINAKAVIVTCGGYAQNQEMIMRLAPEMLYSYTCTNAGATGEVLDMVAGLGGAWYRNQYMITCGFTSDLNYPALGNVLYAGAMPIIDQTGNRIIDETLLWGVNSAITRDIENAPLYAIFDSSVGDVLDAVEEALAGGSRWIVKADTLEELALKMGLNDVDAFIATIDGYNATEETGETDEFGLEHERKAYVKQAPYYGMIIVGLNAGTSGGIRSNIGTEVLDYNGDVIPGLYIAGEASNGDLYDRGYISGTSCLNCYIAGRDAGNAAAEFAQA